MGPTVTDNGLIATELADEFRDSLLQLDRAAIAPEANGCSTTKSDRWKRSRI